MLEEVVFKEGELTQEEMVRIGKDIFYGKGNCSVCHPEIGGRGPSLGNIGMVSETRKPDMDSKGYLIESLVQPNTFVVKGFGSIMPPSTKPPVSLSRGELFSLVAYMQSLGSIVTVTPEDIQTSTIMPEGTPPTTEEAILSKKEDVEEEKVFVPELTDEAVPTKEDDEEADEQIEILVPESIPLIKELVPFVEGDIEAGALICEEQGCTTCHVITAEGEADLAPSLFDIGDRADFEYIRESILYPEAKVIEGFELSMPSYKDKITEKELADLITFLQSLKAEKP